MNDVFSAVREQRLASRSLDELRSMLRMCSVWDHNRNQPPVGNAVGMILDEIHRREAAEAEARMTTLHRRQAENAEVKASQRHQDRLAHDSKLHLKTQRVEWYIFWIGVATLAVASIALFHELLRDREHGAADPVRSPLQTSPAAGR
jgi:hypothetical protein